MCNISWIRLSIFLVSVFFKLSGIRNNRSKSEWGASSPLPYPPTAIIDNL